MISRTSSERNAACRWVGKTVADWPVNVPILTLESSASRSRPQRIVRFRRRAILRRFVPHPRKMAKPRRLVLAKASHPRTNRRGRLVPLRGIRIRVQFPQTRRSARSFQAPRTRLRLEAAYGGSVLAGRKGCASHRHRSGLKIPPRPLSAAGMPSAKWCAILTEERGGRP